MHGVPAIMPATAILRMPESARHTYGNQYNVINKQPNNRITGKTNSQADKS